jgi:hypothetical protein
MEPTFIKWPKTVRLENEKFTITEKLDGTNSQIIITEDYEIFAASRSGFLTAEKDNHKFYQWVRARQETLLNLLGPGRYVGEFVGRGIQRNYGLQEQRFYLFNGLHPDMVDSDFRNALRSINIGFVPVLAEDINFWGLPKEIKDASADLLLNGSQVNHYDQPEGIVIRSNPSNIIWKVIFDGK